MKRFIYSQPDGTAAIVVPSPNALREYRRVHGLAPSDPDPTEREVLDWVWNKDVPAEATDGEEVEDTAFPSDRTFRNAWIKAPGKVDVDMPKARDIVRDRVRKVRVAELERLDTEYMRALEQGDTARQSEVASQKQALRDAPDDPQIEAAQSPSALKAVRPAGLDWTKA